MEVNIAKIVDLINSDNFYKAELEIRKIYTKFPQSFDINKLFGLALLAQRKYNSALKCFERCYEKKKDDYDVTLNLSFIFLKVQYFEKAIEFGKYAIDIQENRPQAYQNLSHSYFFLENYDEAEKFCLKAIEVRGGFDSGNFLDTEDLVLLYGDILIAKNRKDDFIDFALKIIDKKYIQRVLIRLLREDPSKITKQHLDMANEAIEKSKNIEKKVDRNTRESDARFFLAEFYSKNDKAVSEENYIKANQLISDMQRESLFMRQKYAQSIYEFFKKFDYSKIKNIDKNKGDGLIFILGMPRSGTSLIESILSTAENLTTGGEKSFFSVQLFQTITGLIDKEDLNIDEKFFMDLGDRYLEQIKLQRKDNHYFVDKLPENYLFLEFIRIAFPSAKFIHSHRDPWDNAISLFKQNYSINIFYASSFFGIATEYANYEFIMNFWKGINNDEIFNIKYEDLIKSESEITDKLWDFFGFLGKYIPEKRKEHFTYTASMQQISKEIYDSSIEKSDFIDFKLKFMQDLENQRKYWQNRLN